MALCGAEGMNRAIDDKSDVISSRLYLELNLDHSSRIYH